jgi:tetratricopeptide (TPR) repeat protein
MLAMAGEGPEAEKTARRAVQLTEEHGGNYVQLSGHLDTLAYALLVGGKLTEAEAIARKAIGQGEKGKLPGRTQAYEHGTLARILAAQGRTADADAEFVLAAKLAEKSSPSLELARLFEAHAKLLREAGREAEAEPLAQRALALRSPGGLVAEKAPAPADVASP